MAWSFQQLLKKPQIEKTEIVMDLSLLKLNENIYKMGKNVFSLVFIMNLLLLFYNTLESCSHLHLSQKW